MIPLIFQQSFANHRFGFLEILALLSIKIAQVVVCAGVIRKTLEDFFELGLALDVVSLIHIDHRKERTDLLDYFLLVRKMLQHTFE